MGKRTTYPVYRKRGDDYIRQRDMDWCKPCIMGLALLALPWIVDWKAVHDFEADQKAASGYTESQRAAMVGLHAQAMEEANARQTARPFGDMQETADIFGVTPLNIDSVEEWW